MVQSTETAQKINVTVNSFADTVLGIVRDDDLIFSDPENPYAFKTIDKDSPKYPPVTDENGDTIISYVETTVSLSQSVTRHKLTPDGQPVALLPSEYAA